MGFVSPLVSRTNEFQNCVSNSQNSNSNNYSEAVKMLQSCSLIDS